MAVVFSAMVQVGVSAQAAHVVTQVQGAEDALRPPVPLGVPN